MHVGDNTASVTTSVGGSGLVKASYNGADIWTTTNAGPLAVATAVTDKVLIVGSVTDVHAASSRRPGSRRRRSASRRPPAASAG